MLKPTLADLAADLAAGRTSSRALTQACLDRIDDPQGEGGRTFLQVDRNAVLAQADAMDLLRSSRAAPSPYAGIPLSIKDLFDIAGQVTRAGSTALADRPAATQDAAAVARLRSAGFVLIGRTNMTEFAFSGLGLNPHYGTPRNPWERAQGRIPGGSSSGAAISVTDGMAHGADPKLYQADNQTPIMAALGGRGVFGGGGAANPKAAVEVLKVLHDAGTEINIMSIQHHLLRTRGGTALHFAIRSGSAEAVKLLVSWGIDVNARDPDGLTALDYAMARGYVPFLAQRQPPRPDLAKLLRDSGATVELAKVPDWPPVGPPIGYEATIWPLQPSDGLEAASTKYPPMYPPGDLPKFLAAQGLTPKAPASSAANTVASAPVAKIQ